MEYHLPLLERLSGCASFQLRPGSISIPKWTLSLTSVHSTGMDNYHRAHRRFFTDEKRCSRCVTR